MFTRTRIINGREYRQIVESYRTPAGPRQRILASFWQDTLDEAIRACELELDFCERMIGQCDHRLRHPVPGQPEWCHWVDRPGEAPRMKLGNGATGGRMLITTVERDRQEYVRRAKYTRERLEKMRRAAVMVAA